MAMECVPVSSSNDLKQDVRSCVRSVKIQKLYETFVVCHQNRQGRHQSRQHFFGLDSLRFFFLARCCLGQVPGGAPFSQRSEQATACTNRMQIRN